MPIYEYRCESCKAELEKIQKISDPPLTECPQCGKASLVKLVSASGFRLKGSGWYETDFKTGSKKNIAGSGEGGSSGNSSGSKSSNNSSENGSKHSSAGKTTDSAA